jgi:DnaA family protein
MQQLPLELAAPPAPTFDTFWPGPNAQVIALLREWCAPPRAGGCVYLWGARGAGKTHLLRAALAAFEAQGRPARYLASGMHLARDEAEGLQLLALDDVDRLPDAAQAALFTLLNERAETGLNLALAGAGVPAAAGLRPDVATRASQGLVLQVRVLSDEQKHEALRQHARERGFELAADAAEYLLRHGQRDLPSLLRVLDAADRYSLQAQRAVTVPLLREVLQQAGAYLPAM